MAQAHPNSAFNKVTGQLKYETKVPVLLPAFVPSDNQPAFSYISSLSATLYEVELTYVDGCRAGACYIGMVSGQVKPAGQPLSGDIVILKSGAKAYFVDAFCGANCSDSQLIWDSGKYRYMVTGKGEKVETLTKMANSMEKTP